MAVETRQSEVRSPRVVRREARRAAAQAPQWAACRAAEPASARPDRVPERVEGRPLEPRALGVRELGVVERDRVERQERVV
jgi:hypothetical protein